MFRIYQPFKLQQLLMKRKLFFAAGVTVLLSAAVFASAHINNKKNVMCEFFYANVEALASGENLDDTHMWLWWVKEHGGGAITCTFGGELPCE